MPKFSNFEVLLKKTKNIVRMLLHQSSPNSVSLVCMYVKVALKLFTVMFAYFVCKRYLDTSLIDVDVQPKYCRVTVKGKVRCSQAQQAHL